MNIEGLDKLEKTLNNASKNFDMEAEKAVGRVANRLINRVKLKTPVDTGVLRRSWHVNMPQKLTRVVYNNIHYAPHIEYGHRKRGKKSFVNGHRTRGKKSFVNGRYMLTKSVKEIESELDNQLSILIENLWK